YTSRDTILYALGVGFGADPLDANELRFVYEKALSAVPTMASVLASPGFWMRDRQELGIDFLKLVHGEQGVTMHAPLPSAATLVRPQSAAHRPDRRGQGRFPETDPARPGHLRPCVPRHPRAVLRP